MSNAVLVTTAGFKLEAEKIPMWEGVEISRSQAMLETRVLCQVYPLYTINLSIAVLRDQVGLDEAKNLIGFFNLRNGPFDSFLYTDPDDNAVADQQFGIRDGVATQFQLLRAYGGFGEPVNNVNALGNIKSNGVALANPADYTIDAHGAVTLAAGGTPGHVLTWSGSYYWRVRFDPDRLAFGKMFSSLWELKSLPLIGSVMDRV